MKKPGFIFIFLLFTVALQAQPANCTFTSPRFTVNFGTGIIRESHTAVHTVYQRVFSSCPTDGHYSFVPFTSGCFKDDWHTIAADHTEGDAKGNMLLVNAAPAGGIFLSMPISGLKPNTLYELGLWVMNLCKPTKKCPSLLLPSLHIRLQTPEGRLVANIVTRDLPRVPEPRWTQHRAYFTTPASTATLYLIMSDNAPGGCGNDFALDDITFRECVKKIPQPVATQKKPPTKKQAADPKPVAKRTTATTQKKVQPSPAVHPKPDTPARAIAAVKPPATTILPVPLVLKTRENALVRQIDTDPGNINIELYDNGEIDDDTVSIYHNNQLIKSHMRLSQKPISLSITVNAAHPHHELIMVAENLGSIPPNTSVMIVTTPGRRYEVFISSSKQKNAKITFDLK